MRDEQPHRVRAPEIRPIRVSTQISAVRFERRLERKHSYPEKEGEAKIGYRALSHKDALPRLLPHRDDRPVRLKQTTGDGDRNHTARMRIVAECRRDTRHNFSLSRTIASRKRCNLRSPPNTSRDMATRNGLRITRCARHWRLLIRRRAQRHAGVALSRPTRYDAVQQHDETVSPSAPCT